MPKLYNMFNVKFYDPEHRSEKENHRWYEASVPVKIYAGQFEDRTVRSQAFRNLQARYGTMTPDPSMDGLALVSSEISMSDAKEVFEDLCHFLREFVTGPKRERFVDLENQKLYTIRAVLDIPVTASSIHDAIAQLLQAYPGAKEDSIQEMRLGSRALDSCYSDETYKRIWFLPGCTEGENGCILDPMREIAENCSSQEELDTKRHIACDYKDPDAQWCDDYDDECK